MKISSQDAFMKVLELKKCENTQTSEINSKFFSKFFWKHEAPLQLLGIHYSSAFYSIYRYQFLFSRYFDLTEHHFLLDILVPFSDLSDLYSHAWLANIFVICVIGNVI